MVKLGGIALILVPDYPATLSAEPEFVRSPESIPWNRFRGSLFVKKFGLWNLTYLEYCIYIPYISRQSFLIFREKLYQNYENIPEK